VKLNEQELFIYRDSEIIARLEWLCITYLEPSFHNKHSSSILTIVFMSKVLLFTSHWYNRIWYYEGK
jgi:hypothetical protein